ncbi:hypothetical protein D9613_000050 [Agrocybe pediades]|uniref:Uncharacterized protein n=1 Tax=Agrocybe pediades TaxID=84607 RepID=A0A8H4VT70_9AGAR|nr:hypothetical protein D9613_000050 [Agrocybe pediades]
MVPGGRWLLVFQAEGGISCFDLESPTHEKRMVLVPDYIKPAKFNVAFFAVDVSDRLPLHSFLAQYVRGDLDSPEINKYRAIKIWNIVSVMEGTAVTGLQATCLKTILVEPEVLDWDLCLSLKGQHLAFALCPEEPRGWGPSTRYICVVDWSIVEEGSLEYLRKLIYIEMEVKEIHLISNDRVLAFAPPNLSVYDYSSLDCTDYMPAGFPWDFPELSPSSNVPLGTGKKAQTRISAPFVAEDALHLVVFTDDSVQSVHIPDDFGTNGTSDREPHAKKDYFSSRSQVRPAMDC